MELIAETDFYDFRIDRVKNRMYVVYKGFWKTPDQVSDFVKHHAEAVSELSPGFTVVADVRQMEGVIVTDIIEQCQKYAVEAGIRKAARVYAKPTFMEAQADHMHKKTGIKSRGFYGIEDAEAWLDEI